MAQRLSIRLRIFRRLRMYWRRCLTLLAAPMYTPHERALGAALGVTIGILPILPFQLVVLGALCIPIRCHRALAFVTVWIANPLTYLPIYAGEYFLGSQILSLAGFQSPQLDGFTLKQVLAIGPFALLAFLTGGVICAASAGVLTYFPLKLWLNSRSRSTHSTQM